MRAEGCGQDLLEQPGVAVADGHGTSLRVTIPISWPGEAILVRRGVARQAIRNFKQGQWFQLTSRHSGRTHLALNLTWAPRFLTDRLPPARATFSQRPSQSRIASPSSKSNLYL